MQSNLLTDLLPADTMAFLDELAGQLEVPQNHNLREESGIRRDPREQRAAEFVAVHCRKPLMTIVEQGVYDRFKQELTFLISLNHFTLERTRQIESHLKVIDASIDAFSQTLEKWDTGRVLEQKYGLIVKRQSSRAAKLTQMRHELKTDAEKLAELESQMKTILERMSTTSHVINQEYAAHHEELKLFSQYGRDTKAFIDIKEDLDKAMNLIGPCGKISCHDGFSQA